jgi:peptide/nickel transport system substrate-binding protein
MIGRRGFLAGGAAAGVVLPAVAQGVKTITMVPLATLTSVDPIWSSSQVSRNLGFMVFEPLYGRDAAGVPRMLMLDQDAMEDGGKQWRMRLREGLVWHDGEKVRAQDCVASIRRWMRRDTAGVSMGNRLNALEATDDRTLTWRFARPFPHLRLLLSKVVQPVVMMPERVAMTDPFKQITEVIGSGPFRWLANEHVLGNHAAFARFDGYVPRNEPPSYMAGGHKVLVDRVVWKMIPDPATAGNALMTGEVDWVEIPLPDLLPLLRRTRGVRADVLEKAGQILFLRPNHLIGPTNLVGVRKAMMAALSQKEMVDAVIGADPANGAFDVGFLATGKKEVDDAAGDIIRKRYTRDELKALVEKSGYQGEKLVLLHATDHTIFNPMGSVVARSLTNAGFNVDTQAMDWGTVQTRRTSREPLDKGGWSVFPTQVAVAEYRDLIGTSFMRGNGKDGWFGWPNDPKIEAIYDEWLGTSDPAQLTNLERNYELQGFANVPFIPLGRFRQTSAWRDSLSGILEGPCVVFWNITKN